MSSNTGYIITLANSIIGVGILAMPFCFQTCGILLSIFLLILSNLITRLACSYILKASLKVRRKNFEFLASHIFGPSGKLMVELCVIGYLMGTCITYFVVVGDLGPQIIAKLFNLNHSDSLRTITMIIVTIFCIIPLCLLKNIDSLSTICFSSILFYFCLVLKIFFESETKMLSTIWYDNVYWWRPSGITQCLPIFSMALSCQLQIFQIYESLPTPTIDRMNHIIKYGTGICTFVYICVGFFGYVAVYDQQFSGNILLSLTPSIASDIIQMGFVLSVAVSFPLMIFPCRTSLYSLLYHGSHSETAHYIPEHRHKQKLKHITIILVLVALVIGILIPSIELIIGLVGSTIGVAICIMFPASCFIKINKKNSTERLLAQFMLVLGFLIMILGTYANLGAIDEQQSGQQSAANMPIDRLPDIHITNPSKEIPIEPKLPTNKIEMGPKNQADDIHDMNLDKMVKSLPEMDKKAPIREIILNEKESDAIAVRKPQVKVPIVPKLDEGAKSPLLQPAEKPIVIQSQLPEPTMAQKPSDSINNDAIKKEDQEIDIEAKESKQKDDKLAKEILDRLSKQNEQNQKLVLAKIDEISKKVNSIANMQDRTEQKSMPLMKEVENERKDEENVKSANEFEENIEKNKEIPPLDPVVKMLAEQKSSSAPIQSELKGPIEMEHRESEKVELKQKADLKQKSPENPVNEAPVEKSNQNIGRDLLSNSNTNDLPVAESVNASNIKSDPRSDH